MESKIMKFACAAFAFLLTSCGGDPLPKPDILKHPVALQKSRAANMSTKELYDVYRYNASLKPPYDTSFTEILGVRGEEAIDIWLNDIEAEGRPDMGYFIFSHPIVRDSLVFGGYDLCNDDPKFTRTSRLLAREYGSDNAAVTQLEQACAAGRRIALNRNAAAK